MLKGAGKALSGLLEPFRWVADVVTAGGAWAMGIDAEYVQLSSALGNFEKNAVLSGQNPMDVALEGSHQVLFGVFTLGLGPLAKSQIELGIAYNNGQMSLEDYNRASFENLGGALTMLALPRVAERIGGGGEAPGRSAVEVARETKVGVATEISPLESSVRPTELSSGTVADLTSIERVQGQLSRFSETFEAIREMEKPGWDAHMQAISENGLTLMKDIETIGTLKRGNINANIEGGVPEGYAGHHLIPVSSAAKFTVMERAAELGYDINRGSNGIALPRTVELAQESGLPLHNGGHLGSYFDYVEGQLDALQNRYLSGAVTDSTLVSEIGKIENRVRADLLKHRVKLQTTDPH